MPKKKMSKGKKKIEKVMHEYKVGKLKTSAGKKVTNPKQAIAIGLSEARQVGEKIPMPEYKRKRRIKVLKG